MHDHFYAVIMAGGGGDSSMAIISEKTPKADAEIGR